MKALRQCRLERGISQRRLAALGKISFRSVQLLEWGKNDPRVSTLENIATALGFPPKSVNHRIESLLELPPESVAVISERIVREGFNAWKIWLFNFVDVFREMGSPRYIEAPPVLRTPVRIRALIASTVEALCAERGLTFPEWCEAVSPLEEPWFVAGVESLKVSALIESPVYFRKRNIFVMEDFLARI